ncbi:MAG: hypothetical protein K2Z81_03665 [Cyanobacteria bacterium]|nr:hypothetical protein [Cyanobacteriota bacterium]
MYKSMITRLNSCKNMCSQSEGGFNLYFAACVLCGAFIFGTLIGLTLGGWFCVCLSTIGGAIVGACAGTLPYWLFHFGAEVEVTAERREYAAGLKKALTQTHELLKRYPILHEDVAPEILAAVQEEIDKFNEIPTFEEVLCWQGFSDERHGYRRLGSVLLELKYLLDPHHWRPNGRWGPSYKEEFERLYKDLTSK